MSQQRDDKPSNGMDDFIGLDVVLDTGGPLVYLGLLSAYDDGGFWLDQADVHRCDEGHAPREQYVAESRLDGVRANRQRVYVVRQVVTSISLLSDVIP